MKKLSLLILFAIALTSCSQGFYHHKTDKRAQCKHAGKYFDRIDKNADGLITPNEQREFADEKFKELDLDADGRISRDEFKSHMQNHRKRYK
jgi:Ca2+-binding EF-hand superfamily protein